jgi:hypothetical protein
MSRATGCADDPAMLLKVKDALIQTTRKARFCKAQFAAVAAKARVQRLFIWCLYNAGGAVPAAAQRGLMCSWP